MYTVHLDTLRMIHNFRLIAAITSLERKKQGRVDPAFLKNFTEASLTTDIEIIEPLSLPS
jgi:hypothetical protein